MKLIDAPVLVTQFVPSDPWFKAACARIRQLYAAAPQDEKDKNLAKLDDDIWACEGEVNLHKDKTKAGFRVIGVVFINEPQLHLIANGAIHPLRPGTVYHIDGRALHAALPIAARPTGQHQVEARGLFGFMAWDVAKHEAVEELIADIPDAMRAFAAGEKRVNVYDGPASL